MPEIKETSKSSRNNNWIFLKNYKNSISNLRLNINLYYKFSNKIPPKFNWYSLKETKEFMPSFTKKYLDKYQLYFNEKKLAIIGAGIAGLTLANLIKKILIMNLCYMKNKKACH